MARSKKRALKGGIISNLDSWSNPAERYDKQRRERVQAFLDEAERRAEARLDSPDVIQAGMRENVFTFDAQKDARPFSVENCTSLQVLQYKLHPNGVLEKILTPAELKAVELKLFCYECEERQPMDRVEQRRLQQRLRDNGLVPVGGFPDSWERCAYCSNKLGLHEGLQAEILND